MHIWITHPKPEQSKAEEVANSISHGVGLLAALVATPLLLLHAIQQGNRGFIVGASVFAATVIFLYLTSTLYHALQTGKAKRIFRIIEHSAIFLLIAGTYTLSRLEYSGEHWAGRCLG
ncbi:hemolysin III family protein [Vibrio sp. PP-XX7]